MSLARLGCTRIYRKGMSLNVDEMRNKIMNPILLGGALILSFGTVSLAPGSSAMAKIQADSTPTTDLFSQEPNQDNLQMTCNGSIGVNDIDFTVFFTREAGFSRVEFHRRSNGQLIAESFLSYDRKNAKGQAIWRGSVDNAADLTLVHLSTGPGRPGDQVSVSYDGQWGRGTCR